MPTCNIKTYSDADFTRGFIYKVGGVGFDLAGKSMRMIVRKNAADANAVLSLLSADGDIDMHNSPTGGFTVTIKQAELLKVSEGEYVHSLVLDDPTSDEKRQVWHGTMTHAIGPSR